MACKTSLFTRPNFHPGLLRGGVYVDGVGRVVWLDQAPAPPQTTFHDNVPFISSPVPRLMCY